MEDNLDFVNVENERPMFLKVLCILTFVGAGLGILAALFGALTIDASIKSLELSRDLIGAFSFGIDYDALIEATKKWGLISKLMELTGSLLCLFGALMMWKLKKTGFYIYVVGQIIPMISMFGLMKGLGSFAGFIYIAAIFPIAFIVMYALNLKHMK